MSDILTQKEIDQLLQDVSEAKVMKASAGQPGDPKIRVYDFRTANRIPRDQIKTLNLIYETFARQVSIFLTATLGVNCDASLLSIEEQTFLEMSNSIQPGSLMAILKMAPLHGPVLFRLSPEVSYAMIESLLGGDAQPHDFRRSFTEIDLAILEKIIRQILLQVNEAWERIVHVNTVLESIETSIQFAQIVQPGDTIVTVSIGLNIGGNQSLINFCIPQNALEPVNKNLNNRLLATGHPEKKPTDSYHDTILDKIKTSKIPLKAILSETTIRIQDLITLQVGDVIQLDNKTHQPIKLKIGHISRLSGVLGYRNHRYAIKITSVNYEEDQDYE